MSCAVAMPAAASPDLTPRAGEWWFSSWRILPEVWPLTQGGGVTVAILDSGVQASVPDLRGVTLPGGDVTGNRTNGETDFNTATDGHGTQMAVLIAGQGHGTGMVGLAPAAKILPVTVNASAVDLTADPGRVAAGIRYAADHGAKVIDVSQVYPSESAAGCDAAEQSAVAYAVARDTVVVTAEASTNLIGGRPSEPASCAGAVAVGAIQRNGSLWFGNLAEPYLAVVAPGAGLISSGSDGRLVTDESGTRAASALVSGVAALIRSRYPAMPWYQVIQRMTGTALPEGGSAPNDSFGFGIVQPAKAVNATAFPVRAGSPNPVYSKYLAWLRTTRHRPVSRRTPSAAANHQSLLLKITTFALIAISLAAGLAVALAIVLGILTAAAYRLPERGRRGSGPRSVQIPRSREPEPAETLRTPFVEVSLPEPRPGARFADDGYWTPDGGTEQRALASTGPLCQPLTACRAHVQVVGEDKEADRGHGRACRRHRSGCLRRGGDRRADQTRRERYGSGRRRTRGRYLRRDILVD